MGRIIGGVFISLDGVTEAPHLWQFDFDDDMGAAINSFTEKSDSMLLGRITYQEWKDYWPNADEDTFSTFINTSPKYVVSTTLDSVEWGSYENITLLEGDFAEAITKLKQESDGTIGVNGSPTVIRSLLQLDLLDELTLMIHPVMAGSGKRLFADGDSLKRLELIESKVSSTGVIIATYKPKSTE